jgi:2-dehydro-3-deoxyglucarate aldolase
MRTVLEAGRQNGKAVGILSGVEADARAYLEMGMSCVAVGMDVVLLRNASRELRARFAPEPSDAPGEGAGH